MMPQNTNTHKVAVYADEFRWEGLLDIPAHRRLSDFVSDRDLHFIKLRHAKYTHWENRGYGSERESSLMILSKRSIIFIVPLEEAPPKATGNAFDRVEKIPVTMQVHAPPLLLRGNYHVPPQANWLAVMRASHNDFFPLTQVTTWHYVTQTLIDQNLPLVLVQLSHLLGIEPPASADPQI